MAKPSQKADGKKAKIASRSREASTQEVRSAYGTRPEDVVARLEGGLVIAKTPDGAYYRTRASIVGLPIADPNRYGRPSSRLSPEEVQALTAAPVAPAAE